MRGNIQSGHPHGSMSITISLSIQFLKINQSISYKVKKWMRQRIIINLKKNQTFWCKQRKLSNFHVTISLKLMEFLITFMKNSSDHVGEKYKQWRKKNPNHYFGWRKRMGCVHMLWTLNCRAFWRGASHLHQRRSLFFFLQQSYVKLLINLFVIGPITFLIWRAAYNVYDDRIHFSVCYYGVVVVCCSHFWMLGWLNQNNNARRIER